MSHQSQRIQISTGLPAGVIQRVDEAAAAERRTRSAMAALLIERALAAGAVQPVSPPLDQPGPDDR